MERAIIILIAVIYLIWRISDKPKDKGSNPYINKKEKMTELDELLYNPDEFFMKEKEKKGR